MVNDANHELTVKLRAAQELGLDIKQSYSEVAGGFFTTITIEKDGQALFTFPVAVQKTVVLKNLKDESDGLKRRIQEIDAEIIKINELKGQGAGAKPVVK